ncbi:MAG TPA: hypothetical protein VMD55_07725 [Terracidiphilus sp.]|nr:hypothetical protein [Terracidiphilus sp.]
MICLHGPRIAQVVRGDTAILAGAEINEVQQFRVSYYAEDLYRFIVDQFNQSRAFFLELTVVIILVIELVFLFQGKPF